MKPLLLALMAITLTAFSATANPLDVPCVTVGERADALFAYQKTKKRFVFIKVTGNQKGPTALYAIFHDGSALLEQVKYRTSDGQSCMSNRAILMPWTFVWQIMSKSDREVYKRDLKRFSEGLEQQEL